MAHDPRWKNPPGNTNEQLFLWAQTLITELRKGDYLPSTAAEDVTYDNATSGLTATNAQAAIDEVEGRVDTLEAAPDPVVTIINAGALSSQATLDLVVGSTYDLYEVDLINIAPATDNVALWLRFSQSSSFLSGASDYSWSNILAAADESDSEIEMTTGVGNSTNEHGTFRVQIWRPGAASFTKGATWQGGWRNATPASASVVGRGLLMANNNAIDGIRFMFASGDIASGFYAFRGVKFS